MLLFGGRLRRPVLAAALLAAAAIPILVSANNSTAAPDTLSSGLASSANPNPTPRGGTVHFHWNSGTICWDNLGNGSEGGDFFFDWVVWDPFWWTVQCNNGASRSIYIDVLPSNPKGHLGIVDSNGNVTGWACDLDDANAALQVNFYIDGFPDPVGAVIAGEWAGQGVADACRGNPFHGFTFSIPQQWRDGTLHNLSALALNGAGGGTATWLDGSPSGFLISPPAPTNTVAPTITPTTIQSGQTLTSSPGSWTGSPGTFMYSWWRGSAPIEGWQDKLSPSYPVQPVDVGQTIRSSVKACNQTCSAGTFSSNSVVPTAAPPPPVSITEHSLGNYVVFQNQDARYYIGLRCGGYNEAIGSWKPLQRHAGPGYISKIVRLVGGERVVLEPANAQDGLLQGVGVFGAHYARQLGSATPVYGLANASYCWSDAGGLQNLPARAGVKDASVVVQAGPSVVGDTGSLAVEAVLGNTESNLLRIRYEIVVKPSVVYQWTTVTVLCDNGLCQGYKYFLKEPKIAAVLNSPGNDYTRVSCWDSSTSWSASAAAYNKRNDGTRPYAKWAKNDPRPVEVGGNGTMRCMHGSTDPGDNSGSRGRILFDYASDTPADQPTVPDCTSPSTPTVETCFIATGRGIPPGVHAGPGTQLERWENSPPTYTGQTGSFDHWAVKSASLPRLSSNTCSSSMGGPPSNNSNTYNGPDNRRWELYGWSPNPRGSNERGGLFKAWEGGPVVTECRHLFARLGPANDRWAAFNSYSIGPGWENLTNP